MHQITPTHHGMPLGTTRDCLTGTPITIASDSPIASITLSNQPGGTPAKVSTTEITCFEHGEHTFVVHFDDGHIGALRLRAHH
jgi:hypothetical protein